MQLCFAGGASSSGMSVVFQLLGYLCLFGMLAGIGVALFSPLISKRLNRNPNALKSNQFVGATGTNTIAILSLVFAFFFPLLGVIFGHIARSQIRRTGEQGDGLALAGLIIGYISLAATLVSIFYVMSMA